MTRAAIFFAMIIGVSMNADIAFAFAGGATGNNRQCGNCHNGGVAPTVTLTGPTTLAGGATATYEVEITSGDTQAQKHAGLNVATTAGTLAPKSGSMPATRAADGEITQTTTAGPSTTPIKFQFDWTAPLTPGPATLSAIGLSVDGTGGTGGDKAAEITLTVDVTPSTFDLAGLDLTTIPDMTAPAAPLGEMRWGCGCQLGARPTDSSDSRGAVATLSFLLLVVVAGRGRGRFARRHT